MKKFTFSGTATLRRRVLIPVCANSYEEAEEMANNLIEESHDIELYAAGKEELELEIDEFSKESISGSLF